jgi:hypothetical protein
MNAPATFPSDAQASAQRDVGGMLRDARIGMKLEHAPIASSLHIPVSYLAALEKGDWSAMAGDVYARGYIKKYAGYLGFDPQKIMDQLHPVVLSKEPIRTPLLRSHRPPINLQPLLLIGALIFAGVGLAALLATPPVRKVSRSNPSLMHWCNILTVPPPPRFIATVA